MKVDNAIIMAAGTASRFAPLSYEKPKALIEVRGEVLIERQIKQLREAGIKEIVVVTGYMAEQFAYLKDKYDVILVHNPDYLTRNNNASIYAAKKYIKNSYICSSDNYFLDNPFESTVDDTYYSAIYVNGKTDEWCISERNGIITDVVVGGCNAWIMLGHVFWSQEFSKNFLNLLEKEYSAPQTANKLWETIYIDHINELHMKIRKYPADFIFEFDTLDELRTFDKSYINNTRSGILKDIAQRLNIEEKDIQNVTAFKDNNNAAAGFTFESNHKYIYYYAEKRLEEI